MKYVSDPQFLNQSENESNTSIERLQHMKVCKRIKPPLTRGGVIVKICMLIHQRSGRVIILKYFFVVFYVMQDPVDNIF